MNKITLSLLAGFGALAAASAFANHHEMKGEKDWDAKLEAHFAEVDANADGNVSGDEFLAYKRAEAEKHWAKMAEGAGDDGLISLDEMKALHKAKMDAKAAKKEEHGDQ